MHFGTTRRRNSDTYLKWQKHNIQMSRSYKQVSQVFVWNSISIHQESSFRRHGHQQYFDKTHFGTSRAPSSKVTVLNHSSRLFESKGGDQEAAELLQRELENDGVAFLSGAKVSKVETVQMGGAS